MNENEAAEKLGNALKDPGEEIDRFVDIIFRPLPVLTRWEQWRVKFWFRLGYTARGQRIILGALARGNS